MSKLGEQFNEIFAQVDYRVNWSYYKFLEVKERILSFSAVEINKRYYEYAVNTECQPCERIASKVKKTPAENLVATLYIPLVEKELKGLFGEVCDVDFFYIIYDSKRNQLEIEDESDVVFASGGCDELTRKIFKCLKYGDINLDMA